MCAGSLGSSLPQDVVNAKHLCVFEGTGQFHRRRSYWRFLNARNPPLSQVPELHITATKESVQGGRELLCAYSILTASGHRRSWNNCNLVCQNWEGERNKNKTCKNRNQRSLWLEFLLRWWRCAVRTSALLEALPVRYYSLQTVDSGLESIYWETCSWGEWCEGVHSKQGSWHFPFPFAVCCSLLP